MRKNSTYIQLIALLCFAFGQYVCPITLVYNMKIRRAFNISTALQTAPRAIWILTLLPIIFKRNRHIVNEFFKTDLYEKRLTGGVIFNLRFIPQRAWWLELTTGLEKEHVKSCGTTNLDTSRFGLDDIILTGGHNFFPTDRSQFVIYGLGGFPTRRKVTLAEAQDTLVGTRFFGAAIGWEVSYNFIQQQKQTLVGIFQNRFLHFFNRSWTPILPCGAKIQPGNATDLLFTMQYRRRMSIFELGYNPTIFTNQAALLATGPVKSLTAVRQGIFGSMSHMWREAPVLKIPLLLGLGISVAHLKRYDTKILSGWLNLSTLF